MTKLLVFLVSVLFVVSFTTAECDKCGENQECQTCRSSCPDYCNKKAEGEACTLQCIQGCNCKSGYVYEAVDSDRCIKKEECSKMPTCSGEHQVYKTCGSACPKYCGQPANTPCTRQCVQECQCKDGYVKKDAKSSECILASDCPA